jgi:hypothetical protein
MIRWITTPNAHVITSWTSPLIHPAMCSCITDIIAFPGRAVRLRTSQVNRLSEGSERLASPLLTVMSLAELDFLDKNVTVTTVEAASHSIFLLTRPERPGNPYAMAIPHYAAIQTPGVEFPGWGGCLLYPLLSHAVPGHLHVPCLYYTPALSTPYLCPAHSAMQHTVH